MAAEYSGAIWSGALGYLISISYSARGSCTCVVHVKCADARSCYRRHLKDESLTGAADPDRPSVVSPLPRRNIS